MKIYSVIIQGRTLESKNIRKLLSRAVVEKRNLDRKFRMQISRPGENSFPACAGASSGSAS